MKNNKINNVATFDSDFENIPGFHCINLMKGVRKEENKLDKS